MSNRRTRLPSLDSDAEFTITDELGGVNDRLRQLERKGGRAGIVRADTAAKAGEFLNIEGPSAGLTVILPQPTAALRDSRVTLCFRNKNPVRIVCLRGLVNREAFVINGAIGTFEAICDGLDGWSVETGVSSGGSPENAEYILGVAHTSLPNGRVATDSTEIDADLTVPNIASWALNVASVVFAKLQNLTGLSVLGRAANSAGVMAAITAGTARHVLRANAGLTSLEWGFPVDVRANGGTALEAYSLNFLDGTQTTATTGGVAANAVIRFSWNGCIVQQNDVDYLTTAITLDFDSSTSIIPNFLTAVGTEANIVFERAALTGAIAAAQNVNATKFAGILNNGAATTDRTNLNFVPTARTTWGVVDDAANDEIEISTDLVLASISPDYLSDYGEQEETAAGPFDDYARTVSLNGSFMFSNVGAVTLRGMVSAAWARGFPAWIQKQGATGSLTVNDNAGTSGATNRFANFKDKNVVLQDDEILGVVGTDITAGATNDRRWVNFTHRYPFCRTDDMVAGDQIQFDGTNWAAQAFIQFAGAGAVASGDIRKGGDLIVATDVNSSISIAAGSASIEKVTLQAGGEIFLQSTGVGGATTSAKCVEVQAAATGRTVTAGSVAYALVAGSPSPSQAAWKDDGGNVWKSVYSDCSRTTSLATRTNSAGVDTPLTFAIPANMPAGTAFEYYICVQVTRGATVTASNLVVNWRTGGVTRHSQTLPISIVASFTGHIIMRGVFTYLAAPGAAAACGFSGDGVQAITSTTVSVIAQVPSITLTHATNAAVTIDCQVNMSVAVPALSFSIISGFIRRIS